jgi:hypothetical protein
MYFDIEDELLLASVRIKPTETDRERISELLSEITDWNYVFMTAVERGMAPLVLKNFQGFEIPDKVKNALQGAYYRTLSRSMVLYQAFGEVIDTLHSRGIQVIVLKGAYLCECLYEDIGLRQFSDLDLLIREEDGEKAKEALSQIGYRRGNSDSLSQFIESKSDFVHYPPMYKDNMSVELHIRLHQQKESFCIDRDVVWQNAVEQQIAGRKVLVQDIYDLLIHLVIHLHKHFQKGHVQFTSFNDIVNILVLWKFDWEQLDERLIQYNAVDEFYSYIMLISEYYNIVLPDTIKYSKKHLLSELLKNRFEDFFHGKIVEEKQENLVPVHLYNIKRLKSWNDYLHYFRDLLFPPKEFMVKKYNLISSKGDKNAPLGFRGNFWWLWYLYRWGVGVKGLWKVMKPERK